MIFQNHSSELQTKTIIKTKNAEKKIAVSDETHLILQDIRISSEFQEREISARRDNFLQRNSLYCQSADFKEHNLLKQYHIFLKLNHNLHKMKHNVRKRADSSWKGFPNFRCVARFTNLVRRRIKNNRDIFGIWLRYGTNQKSGTNWREMQNWRELHVLRFTSL